MEVTSTAFIDMLEGLAQKGQAPAPRAATRPVTEDDEFFRRKG
jgi:hypothetical protein